MIHFPNILSDGKATECGMRVARHRRDEWGNAVTINDEPLTDTVFCVTCPTCREAVASVRRMIEATTSRGGVR